MNDAGHRTARLVELDQDHPGFRDAGYRERRGIIAELALNHRRGDRVPHAPYTDEEHAVWAMICKRLEPVHERYVASPLLEIARELDLSRTRIPQLAEVNDLVHARTGFRLEPVAGLVAARDFLTALGDGVFLCTQYIRHHSRPEYTPEPDVIHELIGHAASLAEPRIAGMNRAVGELARKADDALIARLERAYWYGTEFGLVMEEGQVKAVGAGLLSSFGELQHAVEEAAHVYWDLDQMAATDYDPTTYQSSFFLAQSFDHFVDDFHAWLERL